MPNTFDSVEDLKYNEALMSAAIFQLQEDLRSGDLDAIYELLENVDTDKLEGFLSEERLQSVKNNCLLDQIRG